jgi:DNA-binding NarL/FixJ family response regulator
MERTLFSGTRVLIADDSQTAIRLISRIVRQQFDLVAAVRDGQAAIDAVLDHRPDVLLLDILMPVLDGIQAARRLTALGVATKIVMLSGLENQAIIEAALAAGASGFVFKSTMASDLLRAIADVLTGRTFVSTHLK